MSASAACNACSFFQVCDYVHRVLAKHGDYEKCLRESLNHCYIIQGMSLFRELGEDCVRCLRKRKAYLDIPEGPIPEENLTIAPPFWVAMCDLYGPCHIFVPGHAHKTRHRSVVEAKCYVFVTVCPVTKLVNLQVIESKSADGILDGITRLVCEVGVPTLMLVDQDSGVMKALREAECDIKNLDMKVHKEKGMRFKTCPVSGHNYHGLVEVKIRTVQECLATCDLDKLRLHATGLQTLCKLVENDMNNLPMGFSYARDANNSPLLKLIFPNMLRIGRMNTRSLDGPIKLPSGPKDLMEKVEKAYTMFYRLWNITMVPRLMKMHKWFDGKAEIKVGDIVYFRKVESELSSKWTVGRVTEVVKGRDEVARRVTVQYQNSNEEGPRFTDRAARSLVKLFNIDDENWQEDMDLVEKLIEESKVSKDDSKVEAARSRLGAVHEEEVVRRKVGVQHKPSARIAKSKFTKPCAACCCLSHCEKSPHTGDNDVELELSDLEVPEVRDVVFVDMLDRSWIEDVTELVESRPSNYIKFQMTDHEEEQLDTVPLVQDQFMNVLCSVNMDLNLKEEDLLVDQTASPDNITVT